MVKNLDLNVNKNLSTLDFSIEYIGHIGIVIINLNEQKLLTKNSYNSNKFQFV